MEIPNSDSPQRHNRETQHHLGGSGTTGHLTIGATYAIMQGSKTEGGHNPDAEHMPLLQRPVKSQVLITERWMEGQTMHFSQGVFSAEK